MRRWLLPMLIGLILAMAAWQVTLRLFPKTLMSLAINRVAQRGGINVFSHAPLATDKARAIVRPSPDLAYSSCPFDLSKGPLLIAATPVTAPYWSLSVFDAQTNAVFVRNDAGGQHRPIKLVIATAGQQVPPGIETVRVDGPRGIALIRILIADRADFAAIDTARRGATCRSLG
jgi:uncharacterized membrane protein